MWLRNMCIFPYTSEDSNFSLFYKTYYPPTDKTLSIFIKIMLLLLTRNMATTPKNGWYIRYSLSMMYGHRERSHRLFENDIIGRKTWSHQRGWNVCKRLGWPKSESSKLQPGYLKSGIHLPRSKALQQTPKDFEGKKRTEVFKKETSWGWAVPSSDQLILASY